jgi:hypothetical protein
MLKRNPTPKIMVTNTIKRTGDIYIKPADSNIRAAIVQKDLNVFIRISLKLNILIYNVDSEHMTEEHIDDLIHLELIQ